MILYPDDLNIFTYDYEIRSVVERLAFKIGFDYSGRLISGRLITMLGIKQACNPFMTDLIRVLYSNGIRVISEYLVSKRYTRGIEPQQDPEIKWDSEGPYHPPINEPIVLVDNVVDTGVTMDRCIKFLKREGYKEIKTCCLLLKRTKLKVDLQIDYVGESISQDPFVVGYGLDLDGHYRNLPHIYSLKRREHEQKET